MEQVGREVSGLAVGQNVAALVPTGGYADRVLINADRLVPRPDGADAIESAAAALNYFIAHQMLHRVAEVRRGNAFWCTARPAGWARLPELAPIGGCRVLRDRIRAQARAGH